MPRAFISYRRDDSAAYGQAIYSKLVQYVPKEYVFMDVDTIDSGVDFVRAIEKAVSESEVLVAIVGNRWAKVSDLAVSRLDDPEDFVRLEIKGLTIWGFMARQTLE